MKLSCIVYGHKWWPIRGRSMCQILGDGDDFEGYITKLKCLDCGKDENVITWSKPRVHLPDNVVKLRSGDEL